MRLTDEERRTIVTLANSRFGDQARVWLFGSRTNGEARGGDIDLFVEAPNVVENAFREIVGFETDLQLELGDQKFDIVLFYPGCQELPIHRIARKTGCLL